MKAPTCDPGNSLVAHGAISTLFIPEKAKSTSTSKRVLHVICFAFLEVGRIGRIVRVGLAFDFDVSFNGRAHGAVEPDLAWLPLGVAGFTEEGPVISMTPLKIFPFEPAQAFVRVSSSGPPPQAGEDFANPLLSKAAKWYAIDWLTIHRNVRRRNWGGRRELNLRPLVPNYRSTNSNCFNWCRCRGQQATFSLAQLYRNCTEPQCLADNSLALTLGYRRERALIYWIPW
jgi:hypothetical protein